MSTNDIAVAPPGSACAAHKHHQPVPTYCELHHVIPQAWQGFWVPPGQPVHTHGVGPVLWDQRTVALCPTGHRNVHYWLVRLMHALPTVAALADPDVKLADAMPLAAKFVRHDAASRHTRVNPNEFATAQLAIERIVEANDGKLDVVEKLVVARLFGEA